MNPVLEVRDLEVDLAIGRGRATGAVRILDGVSLTVAAGETVALVGESGAGKTMLALAVMALLPPGISVVGGSIEIAGEEMVGAANAHVRSVRGRQAAMVFQDPLSSLHPAFRVGDQVAEALLVHHTCAHRHEAHARAVELLASVGVPSPEARAHDFPHQLSGGMRQRVMIAMAIANDPRLVIADEATTALDVTIQAQVLDVLAVAQARTQAGMLVVTHDLGVVSAIADRVVVLYAGRVVEEGSVDDVLGAPAHPYTQGLLRAVPRVTTPTGDLVAIPGQPPDPADRPAGCAFHPRCAFADERCVMELPSLQPVSATRAVACHHPLVRA